MATAATSTARRLRPVQTMAEADRLFASGKGRPEQFGMTTPEAVFAALTNVSFPDGTHGGIGVTAPPQWVGESLDKARYRRSISALVNAEPLLRPELLGFDASNAKPTGGTHNQAGGAVASGDIQFTKWGPEIAFSWATANSFDRTMTDFGIDGNLLSSYTAAAYEVYSKWVDDRTFDAVLDTLTPTAADAGTGNVGAYWSAVIDGIDLVLPNAVPTFALVPVAAVKPMMKQVPPGVIDLIKELTGGDFKVRPDTAGRLTTGQTLVGAAAGVDLYELPGGGVRVSAANLSIGNTDIGVFGYAYPHHLGDDYFALIEQGS